MKRGEIVAEIGPSEKNPRNSEGSFIDLKNGKIMFAYSKFIGESGSDDAKALIAARFSEDGGLTWSDDKTLFKPEDFNALNIMSTSMVRLHNDDICLFFVIRYGWHDTRPFLFRSKDEGNTWEKPVCCAHGPGYYVTNNDRIVLLKNGRLILPTAFHRMRGDHITRWNSFDGRGIPVLFYSDDNGYTWKESENYAYVSIPGSKSGMQEAGVLELYENCLWQWFRTDLGCQYQSFSHDNGLSWSIPEPSRYTSPQSPMSVKRIPHTGDLLAVYNPQPRFDGRWFSKAGDRTPLVYSISRDNGKSKSIPVIIEDDFDSGYCYIAIHFTESAVLLAYCAGSVNDGGCLNRLRMRRIEYNDLYDNLSL